MASGNSWTGAGGAVPSAAIGGASSKPCWCSCRTPYSLHRVEKLGQPVNDHRNQACAWPRSSARPTASHAHFTTRQRCSSGSQDLRCLEQSRFMSSGVATWAPLSAPAMNFTAVSPNIGSCDTQYRSWPSSFGDMPARMSWNSRTKRQPTAGCVSGLTCGITGSWPGSKTGGGAAAGTKTVDTLSRLSATMLTRELMSAPGSNMSGSRLASACKPLTIGN
mmetsp:Transcript_126792/g.253516  ORF Transcript_126792/g.253516 Transcript_126792/m.253516 type:complete len:220 (+) Transcript_126792:1593-2252(+)